MKLIHSYLCATILSLVIIACSACSKAPWGVSSNRWRVGRITLDRVRHCRGRLICRGKISRSDYKPFEKSHDDQMQKHLILSQVNTPPRSRTRNVVFVVAGQQRLVTKREFGAANGLTGQKDNFARGFGEDLYTSTRASVPYTITSNSLVNKILGTGHFSKANTFVGLVFDARFNYNYKAVRKSAIVNGYYNYILSKLDARSPPKTIYLAGHSRGGCLVMRLSQRITAKYPNTRVIVAPFDPVCTVPGSTSILGTEFGVTTKKIDNPVSRNPDYFVYATNMKKQLPKRKCLYVTQWVSGPRVVISKVHAFGHTGLTGPEGSLTINLNEPIPNSNKAIKSRPWYRQLFADERHTEITFNHHSQSGFKQALENMPCSCGN